jgi:hypothetical protein
LLPIQITCVFEKFILRPDIFLNHEHEISQFADDTSVIFDGSEESLNETLLELEWFKKISGLKINFSKTQVIWIGSKKYSSDKKLLMYHQRIEKFHVHVQDFNSFYFRVFSYFYSHYFST